MTSWVIMKRHSISKSEDSHIKCWRTMHFPNKMTISTRLYKRRRSKSALPLSAQWRVKRMWNSVQSSPEHKKARIQTIWQLHLPLMIRGALWPWIRRTKISSLTFFHTRESPQNSSRSRKLTMRASSPLTRVSKLNTAKRCSVCARRGWASLI